jgi:hypothetical protein
VTTPRKRRRRDATRARLARARALAIPAWLIVASACVTIREPTLVEDLSAREARAGAPAADRLTVAELGRLEKALWTVAEGAPPGGRIVLSIVPPPSDPHEVRSSGRHVIMSEAHARWALREIESQSVGDDYLAFVLAHEIGHLSVPECNDACGHTLECERRADEKSREVLERAGVSVAPGALLRTSSSRLALARSSLDGASDCGGDGACIARYRAAAANDCLSGGEVMLRYAVLLREEAEARRGSSWEERGRARAGRAEYEGMRTGYLPRYAQLCADLAGVSTSPDRSCLDLRQAALVRTIEGQPAVHVPLQESRELWSEKVRWQDDADWVVVASAGPAWSGFRHPDRGKGWGWMTSGTALWQGGDADGPGVRVAYGRFRAPTQGDSGGLLDGEVRYLEIELAARNVRALTRRLALVSDIGVGGARIADPSGTRSSVVGTLSGVIAFSPTPRVVLGAGGGYSFSGSLAKTVLTSQVFALHLTLDLYFGDYTTRHIGRAAR